MLKTLRTRALKMVSPSVKPMPPNSATNPSVPGATMESSRPPMRPDDSSNNTRRCAGSGGSGEPAATSPVLARQAV